jgi:GT2 family glycosyltransferase
MDTGTIIPRNYPALSGETGVVVIGRNEGERLVRCLDSLVAYRDRMVYVDSGSSDGSLEVARQRCASVVQLDMTLPFTAARARNAGFKVLVQRWPDTAFVQFVDGDCEVDRDWIATAAAFLIARRDVALVFGRRRERFPEQSVFNAMCDREWDGPAGEVPECGGDILIRASALAALGGYRGRLIAGEEPELCVRLRQQGWRIWRLPAEMTLHDAAMTRLAQWWRRSLRCGHAYAEVSRLHRNSSFRIWGQNLRRTVFWGGVLPGAAVVVATAIHPAALALFLAYPLQVARLAQREPKKKGRWRYALFGLLGKFPEMQGVIRFHLNRLIGRRQVLIEYK